MYVHIYIVLYRTNIPNVMQNLPLNWQAMLCFSTASCFLLRSPLLTISSYLICSFFSFSFLLFPCSNDKQLAYGQLRTFERLSFLLFSKLYIPWSFYLSSWFIFWLKITRLVFHEPTLDYFNIYTTFSKSWIDVFSNFFDISTEFKIV